MRRGPSAHLTWTELACHDAAKTPYPEQWRMTRAVTLAAEFEVIRGIVGAPITIGSAYRTPEHNRAVGGARNSQHVQGRALDLYPPRGWTLERFLLVIRDVALQPGSALFGVGIYPSFIHIDVRPKPSHGQLVVWQGKRAWAEVKNGKRSA